MEKPTVDDPIRNDLLKSSASLKQEVCKEHTVVQWLAFWNEAEKTAERSGYKLCEAVKYKFYN